MNNKQKFKGIVVPAVTPLTKDFKLDITALEKMFHNFHRHNVMPFINGTTGESASLPFKLKKDYITAASKIKHPGDMLYLGISANCLEESVTLAKIGFDNGVDAVAATLPSYYNLSDSQMIRYFEQLAEQVPGPIIIYNIPVTTRMSIPLYVIDELSVHERIIGTKDSERSDDLGFFRGGDPSDPLPGLLRVGITSHVDTALRGSAWAPPSARLAGWGR